MSKHRLINCEFINAGSFKVNISNKAKLLYLLMFTSGDDCGFVDTTEDIINALTKNENEFSNVVSLELLENTYKTALEELKDKGLVYEFKDNHLNKVHLIRHWFFHNKLIKGLWTNYKNFKDLVEIKNNEYVFRKEPLKENNINENKPNENNVSEEQLEKILKEVEPKKKEDDLEEDDLPFAISKEQLKELNNG